MLPNLWLFRKRKRYYSSYSAREGILKRALITLVTIVTLNTLVISLVEGFSLQDSLWLTLTTITTVGYGDIVPKTILGRASIVVFIYFGGITMLARLVSEYFDFRISRKEMKLKGQWVWKSMKNHILIVNVPELDTEKYLLRFIGAIRDTPSLVDHPIQIMSNHYANGLPHALQRFDNLVHFAGDPDDSGNLVSCNVAKAAYIVVFVADISFNHADAIIFDTLYRIKHIGTTARILVECKNDHPFNRERFKDMGASSVLRPVRSYPELLVRAIESPGSEKALENLFAYHGERIHCIVTDFQEVAWKTLVLKAMEINTGILLGYLDVSGEPVLNPDINLTVTGSGLLLLVKEDKHVEVEMGRAEKIISDLTQ